MSDQFKHRTTKSDRFQQWEAIAYAGCVDGARGGSIDRDQARRVMRAAVERYYPNCVYAFGHGSALTGSFKAYSDLDLIIFDHEGANWEIRHEIVDGWPVQFVTYSIDTVEVAAMLALQTRMKLPLAAVDSVIVTDRRGDAAAFQARLTAMAEGLPFIDRTHERENVRAQLFAVLIDLHKDRDIEVAQAIVISNYKGYLQGISLLHNGWMHQGRHFMKNPDLPESSRVGELHGAIASLMAGSVAEIVAYTEDLLEELGGGLWSGRATSLEVRPEYLPVVRMLLTALSG